MDITTPENRTRRIAVLDTFFLVGLAVGLQGSGIIRNYLGWVPLFLTSSLILILNILYVVFYIKEGKKTDEDLHKISKSERKELILSFHPEFRLLDRVCNVWLPVLVLGRYVELVYGTNTKSYKYLLYLEQKNLAK